MMGNGHKTREPEECLGDGFEDVLGGSIDRVHTIGELRGARGGFRVSRGVCAGDRGIFKIQPDGGE